MDKAPGGDASSAFDLPFSETEIVDLLRSVDIRRDLAAEDVTESLELRQLGGELFNTEQRAYLALSEPLPIVRYLPQPRPLPALAVEQEWRVIETALASLVAGGEVILERLEPPTFDALAERLLGEPVHVLHFVGHGLYEPEREAGMLIFEKADGRGRDVQAGALAMLLHNHISMRLVYLNACEGAISDQGNVFAGVAQTLVQQGVPAAVAMQDAISDEAAVEMARTFYTALATGRPVDAALTHARVTLATRGNDEWVIPVLFSRSPDNQLLQLPEGDARLVIERQKPWEPETVKIDGGEFIMGSDAGAGVPDNETPAHTVMLPAYRIGKTLVTNAQYQHCVNEGICEVPDNDDWAIPDNAQRPVTDVSWFDADTYAKWVGGRLPTEAEWEKTCRSTDGRIYPWGDGPPSKALLNYNSYSAGSTTDVGSYPPGVNHLYDMAGNVWE